MIYHIIYIYICTCCICVYTYASTFAIRMHLHVISTLQWYWWWADVRQEEPPPDGEEVEPTPPKMERRLNEETCPAYVLLPWWRNGETGFHGFESPCWSMLYHFMDFYICFTIMDTDTYYCRMMVDCAGMPHGRVTPVHGHQMDEIMNHARW